MIPTADLGVYEAGMAELAAFADRTHVRGKFVSMYLGFRLMGDQLAPLGSAEWTESTQIESFLDTMWTKTHRPDSLRVLTAAFGTSHAYGPYKVRSGEQSPHNAVKSNNWRNHFRIQKGIGCNAGVATLAVIGHDADARLTCPHLATDSDGQLCTITGGHYRGERHSIWLSGPPGAPGFQVVDLDEASAYDDYLTPSGERIPLYPLLAVLYGFAAPGVYPPRATVSIVEFAADFGYPVDRVVELYDTDATSPANARILALAAGAPVPVAPPVVLAPAPPVLTSSPLPEVGAQILMNNGVAAEVAVAQDLEALGWQVAYTGNQMKLGYDLRATRGATTLAVEVKSSVGYVTPELTASEWAAAVQYGEDFLLALVDFVGKPEQAIRYVTGPALKVEPAIKVTYSYRLTRGELDALEPPAL